MINNKIFNLIEGEVKNKKLKNLIKIQYVQDEWGSCISGLKLLIESNTLNEFDYKVARIFLCRDYSLTYKHGLSFDIIGDYESIVNGLKKNRQNHLALLGFLHHQFVIALGYMGKRNDDRVKKFFDESLTIYNKLGAESEKVDLIIHQIDLDFYYNDPLGMPDLINRYKKISDEFYLEKGIFFRLGLINLMTYLKTDRKKFLDDSIDNLNNQLKSSDPNHYRNYFTECALIIAQYSKNGAIGKLPNAPKGAVSKAERFPLTMFLMLRAYRISGGNKKSIRLLFNIERKLKNLISDFEDPDYKKFIFLSYGIILEEWMLSIIEDSDLSNEERFKYLIHVNEIMQNRLLAENIKSYLSDNEGLINIDDILNQIVQHESETSLIYVTLTIKNIQNEKQFAILVAEKIGHKDTYSVNIIDSNSLYDIENQFIDKFILNHGSTKKEQDNVLDIYGERLFQHNRFRFSKRTLVIPNNFCLTLPLHMARINGKYLYEKSNYRYLPNLNIVNSKVRKPVEKKSSMTIFYTSKDKAASIEAHSMKKSLSNKAIRLIQDPDLDEVQELSKKADSIHTIAHGSGNDIIFNTKIINGIKFCNALPNDLETVSFSVCKSGAISQDETYPIEHRGWTHRMLLKKTKRVLTHTWDLGQDASKQFAVNYYQDKDDRLEMKKFKPSEYGGYMHWGLSL